MTKMENGPEQWRLSVPKVSIVSFESALFHRLFLNSFRLRNSSIVDRFRVRVQPLVTHPKREKTSSRAMFLLLPFFFLFFFFTFFISLAAEH